MDNCSLVSLACPLIHCVDQEWGRSYRLCSTSL